MPNGQFEKKCSIFASNERGFIMSEKKQKIQRLRGKLNSNDTKIVIQTLEQIKDSGEAELIPDLIQVLEETEISEVGDKVLDILNNLQAQDSVAEIVRMIKQVEDDQLVASVLASCWKNRLDFSAYLHDLAEIFVHADFKSALEAFTVIENATPHVTAESIDESMQTIKNHIRSIDPGKKTLMMELIHLLENKKHQKF